MSTNSQTSTQRMMARRKLVRGAFAAPAMMTVCSGSAFAASSALRPLSTRCSSPTWQPKSAATDNWMRVQCFQYGSGSTAQYFVSGADLHSSFKKTGNSICVGSTAYRQVNFSSNTCGTMGASDCALPSGSARCATYVGVGFDSSGNVICIGQGGSSQSHVSLACWTSVAPHL